MSSTASSFKRSEPNSTGIILHQEASESVEEMRRVLDSLGNAVPAAKPAPPTPAAVTNNNNNQLQGASSNAADDSSNVQVQNSSAKILSSNSSNNQQHASLSVNERIFHYEASRSDILRMRKKLLIDLRTKLIQPLAQASSKGSRSYSIYQQVAANNQLAPFNTTPLLEVHKLTLELLSIDEDMKLELNSETPLTMNDLANSAANSRGKNELSSLIPVAWCIRVSYAEAVKFEMYLNQNNNDNNQEDPTQQQEQDQQRSLDNCSSSLNPSVYAEYQRGNTNTNENDESENNNNKSEEQVAADAAGERQQLEREPTMIERLKSSVSCWKTVIEMGQVPKSVLDYIVSMAD